MNWQVSAETAHANVIVPLIGLKREVCLHRGASAYTLEMPYFGPEAIVALDFQDALRQADYVLAHVGYKAA